MALCAQGGGVPLRPAGAPAALEAARRELGVEARDPGPSPFHDLFDWIGTDDPSAYLSVPAAIAFQREHDWPQVRAACHALADEARERIGALTGLPQICPDTADWWRQMCTAPLPKHEGVAKEDLQQRLFDAFQVEVPISDWNNQRFVRVSIQAYNPQRDVDRLVEALASVL